MTSNLNTTGEIKGRAVIATRELHADGPTFLNSTVAVGGVCTINNVLNARNAVTIRVEEEKILVRG